MPAPKIHHDLPPDKEGHAAYMKAWRAKRAKVQPKKRKVVRFTSGLGKYADWAVSHICGTGTKIQAYES